MNSAVKVCTHRYTVTWSTAALGEQFFDVTLGQAGAQIPAHGECDHLTREP